MIEGWMTASELEWLERVASRMNRIAEIGSWKGRSTSALLRGCPGPVYAVDHWQGSRDEREGPHREANERDIFADFMANVGEFANLRVRRGESASVAPTLPLMDMVFIDAGHSYDEVKADIEAWAPKTVKVLAGHDYHLPDVRRAVDEAFGDRVKTAAESIWYVNVPTPRRIRVATPAYGGMLTTRYVRSLELAREWLPQQGINIAALYNVTGGDSLIPRARIACVSKFLDDPDSTHLLFIDSDISFEPEHIAQLVYTDHDVVGGVYPKKALPIAFPMNFSEKYSSPADRRWLVRDQETGCFEAQDVPTGFLLIKRSAIEQMIDAYPDRRCMINEGGWEENRNCYDLFPVGVMDDSGMYLSEDFGFCRLWQKIGGKVWVLPEIELGHTGQYEFRGKLSDLIMKEEEVGDPVC
jgi:hypothetical protein